MDWHRAKNIIIIMLLILNACLFSFNYALAGHKYYLTNKQIETINEVLTNNFSCSLDKNVIIREFKPKNRIIMEPYNFDEFQLSNIFFSSDANITNEDGRINITDETGIVIINGNKFQFYRTIETAGEQVVRNIAEEQCLAILKSLGKEFNSFKLDKIYSLDDSQMVISYKDTFKNYTIDSSYIEFVVDSLGVFRIDASYKKATAFEKDLAKEIVAPDEVLFSLIKDIKANEDLDTIKINGMKLVYCEEDQITENDIVYSIPCYSLYLNDEPNPILITADPYNMRIL